MPVNPKRGLTFATGLRAILRQDPDVILVGEIRDGETADISIRSALTGHLLLSTLHTNDAISSIGRLVDMGVEPFLVASVLEGVLARLGRRICQECREEIAIDRDPRLSDAEWELLGGRAFRGQDAPLAIKLAPVAESGSLIEWNCQHASSMLIARGRPPAN